MKPDRRQAIKQAHDLSQQGRTDDAVRVLMTAGVADEAARLLAQEWRHADAGRLLLEFVGGIHTDFSTLDADRRKLVQMAAHYYAKAGQEKMAADLYLALGERARAIELLEKIGDTETVEQLKRMSKGSAQLGPAAAATAPPPRARDSQDLLRARELENTGKKELALQLYVEQRQWKAAGRLAREMGRYEEAVRYYINGDFNFEAAICHLDAGDAEASLEALVRVRPTDSRYRSACIQAVRTASEFGILNIELDTFLTEFIRTGPVDDLEVDQFMLLGKLYQDHDFPENAREVYKKVVLQDPTNVEAGKNLIALDRVLRGETRQLQKILEEDDQFDKVDRVHLREPGSQDLADLPDLPGLPDLPELPGQAAAPAAAVPTAPPFALFKVGAKITERYVVSEILGQGGTAVVVKARDNELEEMVAIKLLQEQNYSEEALDRFRRELKLSRRLSHPNIIRVHDIGTFHGHRYITMEYLEGDSLENRIGIPFDTAEGIALIQQACEGLHAAHTAGVVHRDVKPGNFFVTTAGVLKVMDFGMARQTDLPAGVTQLGTVAGTPNYMSPEQINRPSEVTARADLYSLGVVMFEMFTGDLPFSHADLMPLLMMHSTQPPPNPQDLNPHIPDDLSAAILKLLEKNPEDRYASAQELSQHLRMIEYQLGKEAEDSSST